MSRFHKLLNRAYREIITEQDQPPVPAEPQVQPDQAVPTPIPEIKDNSKKEFNSKEPLSPENFVFLVRLLPKALMIANLDVKEQSMLANIGEINEENASKVLEDIMPIITKYAPSADDLPKT